MQKTELMAHCGTQYVAEEAVRAVPVPDFTDSWRPYQHGLLLDALAAACEGEGMTVANRRYSLDKSGAKMFGVWEISNGTEGEYNVAIGIRNSMNKSFAAGVCAGQHVFVCDNLCFSSQFVVLRKHTARFCAEEMVFIAQQAVAALGPQVQGYNNWVGQLKEQELKPSTAALLTMAAIQRGILTTQQMQDFNALYFDPAGKYTPTLHGFHGAATELMRDSSLFTVSRRNETLNSFLQYEAPILMAQGEREKTAGVFTFDAVRSDADVIERKAKADTAAALKDATTATRAEAKEVRWQRLLAKLEEKADTMQIDFFNTTKGSALVKLTAWIEKLTAEIDSVPDDMRNRYNWRAVLRKLRAQARRDLKAYTEANAAKVKQRTGAAAKVLAEAGHKAKPATKKPKAKPKAKPATKKARPGVPKRQVKATKSKPTVVATKGKKEADKPAEGAKKPRYVTLKGTARGKGTMRPATRAAKTTATRCHQCQAVILKGDSSCGACGAAQ